MKKIIFYITLAFSLSSCSEQEQSPLLSGSVSATFIPTLDAAQLGRGTLPLSRAADDEWLGDEVVGVAAFLKEDGVQWTDRFHQYEPYDGVSGARVRLVPVSGEDPIFYPVDEDVITFTAFSPYQEDVDGVVSYDLSVQSIDSDVDVLNAIDFIFHKSSVGYSQSNPVVTLNFQHKLCRVIVNLILDNSLNTIEDAELTINNVYTSVSCSLSDGAVTGSGSADGALVPIRMLNEEKAVSFQAIVAPQSSTSSLSATKRTLTFTVSDRTYTINLTDDFVGGNSYEVNTLYSEMDIQLASVVITPWITNEYDYGNIIHDFPDDWDADIDWDQPLVFDGESNCYIVPPGGQLLIPISRAATFSNTDAGKDHPTLEKGEEFYAKLYWSDTAGLLTEENITTIGTGPNGYLLVKPGEVSGNAVVAVQKKTGEGETEEDFTTLWSWHVWVTDYDPNVNGATFTNIWNTNNNGSHFVFMDRNLGATYAGSGYGLGTGLFYQWGRKDPFPATLGSGEKQAGGGSFTIATTTESLGTIENTVKNPSVFLTAQSMYGNWQYFGFSYDIWGGVNGKSFYDPCPVGWRLPFTIGPNDEGSPGYGLETLEHDITTEGVIIGVNAVYPMTGWREYKTGEFVLLGQNAIILVAGVDYEGELYEDQVGYTSMIDVYIQHDYSMNRAYGKIDLGSGNYTANGASVRCVKE